MVVFICDGCQETLSRAKALVHRCRAPLSCVDCHTRFSSGTVASHTQCISEQEKYHNVAKKPDQGRSKFALALSYVVENKLGSAQQQSALAELVTSANIDVVPTKKKKFVNFCKSAKPRVFYNIALAEAIFDLISLNMTKEDAAPPKPSSKPTPGSLAPSSSAPSLLSRPLGEPREQTESENENQEEEEEEEDLAQRIKQALEQHFSSEADDRTAPTLGDLSRQLQVDKPVLKAAVKRSAGFELLRDGSKKRVRLREGQ